MCLISYLPCTKMSRKMKVVNVITMLEFRNIHKAKVFVLTTGDGTPNFPAKLNGHIKGL